MEAAGPALRRSVAICKTLIDDDPENISYRDILGRTLIDLGRWQREAGDAGDADMSFREAIEHLDRLVRGDPGPAVHCIWLALGHANRGTLLLRQEQPREAEACHKRAIDVYRRALEKNPQDHQIRNELASTYANCPIERLRDPEEAVRLGRENVRDDPEAGAFLGTLGIAFYRTGRPEALREASASLDRAAERFAAGRPRELFFHAMIYRRLGEAKRAGELYARAVARMQETSPRAYDLILLRNEAARVLGTTQAAR